MNGRAHEFLWRNLGIGLVLLSVAAQCHESPNEVIDALTHRIEDGGATAGLLVSRAYEYRAYGEMLSAESDLRAALALDGGNGAAYVSLGQLLVYLGRGEEALRIVDSGLAEVEDRDFRAGLHALGAEAHGLGKSWTRALGEIDLALEVSSGELEWMLLKSWILGELERHDDRVAYVREASEENGSVVLAIELIDALRDAGRYRECLGLIEGYIGKRRWKAEWLLRRAEVFRVMGDGVGMRADAERALDEIADRLSLNNPEAFLYELRAKAMALLEESDPRFTSPEEEEIDIEAVVSVTVLDVELNEKE